MDMNMNMTTTDLGALPAHISGKYQLKPGAKVHWPKLIISGDGYLYLTGSGQLEIDCLKIEKDKCSVSYDILIQTPNGVAGDV